MAMRPIVPGEVAFPRERLSRLAALERWHFWFIGRRILVRRLLDRYCDKSGRILDVGCGTGLMVESLLEWGRDVVGLDLRPEGLQRTRRAFPRAGMVQAEATELPFAGESFRVVMLLDVLEHVDDHRLLEEVHRVLEPGGVAIITVPAMPWLWSYRDEAAGHRRRYTSRQLASLAADRRLEVRDMRYYQCLLFPLIVITRLLGRWDPTAREREERPQPRLNGLLTRINLFEVKLGDVIAWPWGSSLVAVCQKMIR